MNTVLVTGGAGFIGSHLASRLLAAGKTVRVLDNLDPFYDPALKRKNLDELARTGGQRFEFLDGDLRDAGKC
ncbi:MAG TPA: GDP-mannose 4,6-dehydratase, partial [Planctomycetota bacterium]|nr:GDP-mannose 4,6-dehydratase [Planctomycetota bacterium]